MEKNREHRVCGRDRESRKVKLDFKNNTLYSQMCSENAFYKGLTEVLASTSMLITELLTLTPRSITS